MIKTTSSVREWGGREGWGASVNYMVHFNPAHLRGGWGWGIMGRDPDKLLLLIKFVCEEQDGEQNEKWGGLVR